jgi:hypothetical protein
MINSVAGKDGNPLMSAYSASKHAKSDIQSTVVNPALISTVTARISSTSSSRRTQETKPRHGTRTA